MCHKLNFGKNRKNDLIPFYSAAVLMALFSLILPVSVVFARSLMKKYPHPVHWAAFTLVGEAE
jgi:CHAT domain-containing protein